MVVRSDESPHSRDYNYDSGSEQRASKKLRTRKVYREEERKVLCRFCSNRYASVKARNHHEKAKHPSQLTALLTRQPQPAQGSSSAYNPEPHSTPGTPIPHPHPYMSPVARSHTHTHVAPQAASPHSLHSHSTCTDYAPSPRQDWDHPPAYDTDTDLCATPPQCPYQTQTAPGVSMHQSAGGPMRQRSHSQNSATMSWVTRRDADVHLIDEMEALSLVMSGWNEPWPCSHEDMRIMQEAANHLRVAMPDWCSSASSVLTAANRVAHHVVRITENAVQHCGPI